MAKIGSFGDVTFEISENDNGIKALSFQKLFIQNIHETGKNRGWSSQIRGWMK